MNSNKSLVRNSKREYLGASIINNIRTINKIREFEPQYVSVSNLAEMLKTDKVLEVANTDKNSVVIQIDGTQVQSIPYQKLHKYSNLLIDEIITLQDTYDSFNELAQNFENVELSFDDLRYISKNHVNSDVKLSNELNIPESVVTLAKLKSGITNLTDNKINRLVSNINKLRNQTSSTSQNNLEKIISIDSEEFIALELHT